MRSSVSTSLILLLAGSIMLAACHSEKPESGQPVDIDKAATRAGININRNPGAAVRPEDIKHGERMTVIGMLREVGTARFSKLVLTPLANFDIYLSIKKDQIPDYPKLQYKFIEVTGIVSVQKVQYGTIERDWYSMTVESAKHIKK